MSASARPSSSQRQECERALPMHRIQTLNDHDAGASLHSRRSFLIAMIGTGAMLGFTRPACAAFELPASAAGETESGAAELFEPTMWYGVDRSGVVTVNIIRAEMGQHVGTALARIVADELEGGWTKWRIVHLDSDPKWRLMVTGGSWSVWQSFPILSQAGAAGRIALTQEGARLLGVKPEDC